MYVFDVRTLGARGDGISNDTPYFKKAIDLAHEASDDRVQPATGATVLVPPGRYKISEPLQVRGIQILGQTAGGWPNGQLPTIVWDQTGLHATIIAESDSSIHGVSIEKPRGGILINGKHVSISNVTIIRPVMYGIITAGYELDSAGNPRDMVNTGRLYIGNVLIKQIQDFSDPSSGGRPPMGVGIKIEGGKDDSIVENVEVWNYDPKSESDPSPKQMGRGFWFRGFDGLRTKNLFAHSCITGFFIDSSPSCGGNPTALWGNLYECMSDNCHYGMQIEGEEHNFGIHGGGHKSHVDCINVSAPKSRIGIHGCSLDTLSGSLIRVEDADQLCITGVAGQHRNGTASGDRSIGQILINKAGNVSVTGCSMGRFSNGVVIGSGVERAAICGNSFACDPEHYYAIINNRPDHVQEGLNAWLPSRTP